MGKNGKSAIEILHEQHNQFCALYSDFERLTSSSSIPEIYEREFPHFAFRINAISLELIAAWNQIVEQGGLTPAEKAYLSRKCEDRIANRPRGYHYSFSTPTDPAHSLQTALKHIVWLVAIYTQLSKPSTSSEDIAHQQAAITYHMDKAHLQIKEMWKEFLRNAGITGEGMALITAARREKGLPPISPNNRR